MAHGCSIGTPYGRMARPQPVQPIPVHVSLALSPLGFSCVSMCLCGPWCILVHSDAFLCIHVHSCAFLSIMKRVRSRPGAHRNRVFSLLSALEYIMMHSDASQVENAAHSKRTKLRMYWNALRCGMYRMQHTKNAHECILCNECTRMQQAKKMQPK